ncbi:MAG: hypothetical protein ACK5NC_13185 [Vibrio sp.]
MWLSLYFPSSNATRLEEAYSNQLGVDESSFTLPTECPSTFFCANPYGMPIVVCQESAPKKGK